MSAAAAWYSRRQLLFDGVGDVVFFHSEQVKSQSALSLMMLLGKLNPLGKSNRAGPGFSAGPKGKEKQAEHGPPSQPPRADVAEHERPPPPAQRSGSVKIEGKAHQKELDFAKEEAAKGHHIVMNGIEGRHDYWIDGVKWEYKRLESSTLDAVRRNLRKGLDQASHVAIDGRGSGLTREVASEALQQHVRAGRMKNAVEVRILTAEGEINWRP